MPLPVNSLLSLAEAADAEALAAQTRANILRVGAIATAVRESAPDAHDIIALYFDGELAEDATDAVPACVVVDATSDVYDGNHEIIDATIPEWATSMTLPIDAVSFNEETGEHFIDVPAAIAALRTVAPL